MVSPFKCLLASALVVSCVDAHGWLSKPEATFSNEAGDKTQFIATIEASSSGFKGTFNTAPKENVASFTKAFDASTYKSLKAFIDDKAKITVSGATLTCGNAEPDATAQPLPAKLEWYHSESEGFTASHEGPCEAWCDNERVFHDENCAAHFTTAPAVMPYEKSKCAGASKLTFFWMAMHGPTWQVYVNCATLSGGSGGGAVTQSSGSSATTTDSSSAGSPAAQTPPSGGSPSTPTTGSSSADTPSVTPAPSSGGTPSITPAPASGGPPSTPNTPPSNTTPSTSTTSAPSTPTTDESDCGSYDVAGSDEDCGSYDVAGGSADEGQDTKQTSTGGNTYQQGSTTTGGKTYQQGSTNTGGNSNQWSNTGGSTNQWSINGGNSNQWTNTGTGSQQNPYQGTGTGSQNSFDFNTFQGTPNAGTVAPQYM